MTEVDVSKVMHGVAELLRARKWGEAEGELRKVVEAAPDYMHGVHCLGFALARQKRFDEAIAHLKRAAEMAPEVGGYRANLAAALWEAGDSNGALEAYDLAVKAEPENAGVWETYAGALMESGDVAAGVRALAQAARLKPELVGVRSKLVGAMLWDPPAGMEAGGLRKVHEALGQRMAGAARGWEFQNERVVEKTLKVGYVFPAKASLAAFMEPVLSRHDPEQVEAVCYVDGAATAESARLREQVTHWVDASALSNGELAELVRGDRVDVLVDLAGHFSGGRMGLFAQNVAPVQVAYWGYPFMTGLASMGYRITDAVADPPGEGEAGVIRLPACAVAWRPPRGFGEVGALPALQLREVTFGSLNPVRSLTAGVVAVWAQVLGAVEKSTLVIHLPGDGRKAAVTRLRAMFAEHGVGPRRVTFETGEDRLALYERIDVALDAFPVSDPAVVCEALWMGLPVVAGGGMGAGEVARRSASVLTAAGMGELVATDEAGYVALAKKLTTSLMQLGALRRTLRSRMRNSDLLKEAAVTRRLEMAYREMWRAWCGAT